MNGKAAVKKVREVRAIADSWSGAHSEAVHVLNRIRAALGLEEAPKPLVQQEILGSTEGPGRGL